MNELTDHDLLRDYAERQSEPAFAELVRRHIDFVYSAALRMVRDPHTAADVTQNTFIALTKNPLQVRDRSLISSWLHSTARNFAANTIRTEVRRREREQEAAAMNALLANEPEALWKNISPHLDDAIAELTDADRDALLLRYFERKSAREMGQIFGTSEETAQKRVSRAVERLRELFAKRGVTAGAGGLAVLISANAVQAAPLAPPASISTAAALAGTTLHTSTIVTTSKVIAMTTMQKSLVFATVAIVLGTGIYQAARLRARSAVLRPEQSSPNEQIQQLQEQNAELSNKVAALIEENEQLKRNEAELLKLRGEVGFLRQQTNETAKLRAEVIQLQPPKESKLTNSPDIARLMSDKQNCGEAWVRAFISYARKHQGQFPSTFEEAEPYWDPHYGTWPDVTPDQFEILYHGSFAAITNQEVILFREKKLWQNVNGRWGRLDYLINSEGDHGHAQYGSVDPGVPDTVFSDYEKEHTVSATAQ